MALRLRRDVQKASYYVWFLGAEEAKGLRGSRVINAALPYLIDRSRSQEPLKVTLQVSHKGIKILQGSSKHFIPHSAITSSVQTDDIVACVLLLYNPTTKCPLHVHAYRCDSETTAEALQQQLQILINRPENQKRFEELESRLDILPPMQISGKKPIKSSSHNVNGHGNGHGHKALQQKSQHEQQQHTGPLRRQESSPKRFSSSLGSDTGNSTRESECSEEHNGESPVSRSPPILKPIATQPTNELFDSLAAELRAKLNGNGPPLLLPPRDYDTVHRSKGNLAAIELRRCRNTLIVGSTTANVTPPTGQTVVGNGGAAVVGPGGKQVSSRGSSGIGSDLAPSPERQELNSSSDDDHWSNEADNSVIALKPSQIAMDRSAPVLAHHPQLNRKSAVKPPEDSYLRDLPNKPYIPKQHNNSINNRENDLEKDTRSKTTNSALPWSREDEIKPIIMRPTDYDAKFNWVLQAEQPKQDFQRGNKDGNPRQHAKLHDTDKYNEINRLLNKKLSLERTPQEDRFNHQLDDDRHDLDDSELHGGHGHGHGLGHGQPPVSYQRKEKNVTDKQKFLEYTSSKKQQKSFAAEEVQKYGGRQRYVDPADLPFEQIATAPHNKYAAIHLGPPATSPEREAHRPTVKRPERSRENQRDMGEIDGPRRRHSREIDRDRDQERDRDRDRDHNRERDRDHFSRSNERNPYREPESLPYIQSMEKMMKSSAMRYKSFDSTTDTQDDGHIKLSQRSKSYPKHDEDRDYNNTYLRNRNDYETSTINSNSTTPKDRFKDAKDKFRAMEQAGSRYDLSEEKDLCADYKPRQRGSIEVVNNNRVYDDWSDEERLDRSPTPPPMTSSRSRSRSREQWIEHTTVPIREKSTSRDFPRIDNRDYSRDVRPRDHPGVPVKRPESRDIRADVRVEYARDHQRVNSERLRDRMESNEYGREHSRHEYSPDGRSTGRDPRSESQHIPYNNGRPIEKQRIIHPDMYPSSPPRSGIGMQNSKNLSNLKGGYRHSYAEPVFARNGGRVGLAAVNPY